MLKTKFVFKGTDTIVQETTDLFEEVFDNPNDADVLRKNFEKMKKNIVIIEDSQEVALKTNTNN